MLPKRDIKKVIELAKKYKIGKMYLVGSSISKASKAADYDFAVIGVPSGAFFLFYGELMMSLPKLVDLIDLSGKETKFTKIIKREGKVIYDKKAA